VIVCTFGREPKSQTSQRCTLKRKDRRSLFRSRQPAENRFSAWQRPARTSPSTFLFLPIHLSNSRGPWRSPPSVNRGPAKLHASETVGCCFTVPVRSFTGAQSRRERTARRRAYIGLAPARCQPIKGCFQCFPQRFLRQTCTAYRRQSPVYEGALGVCRAALKPYSWSVLSGQFEGWKRNGGATLSFRFLQIPAHRLRR